VRTEGIRLICFARSVRARALGVPGARFSVFPQWNGPGRTGHPPRYDRFEAGVRVGGPTARICNWRNIGRDSCVSRRHW
jgi:hypothetical protein